MRVSLKWLKELLPALPLERYSLSEFTSRLDLTGTAFEGAEVTGEALDGVMVGQIVEMVKHPNADTLWITRVDCGADEPLQIVCGAQNFKVGDKVPVATVGTTLPGGVTIKKSKLRGEVSCGMNCSARELGVGGDADGLLILDADAPIGAPFAQYAGRADTVLDFEITPNRPDCLSLRGIAREVGAVFEVDVPPLPDVVVEETAESVQTSASVVVEEPSLCPRYTARVIRDVKIGPSPDWLVQRVEASGARSINNIVDITNFVMFETGQPLHAFDLDTIAKDDSGRARVVIRRAHAGETITTLDDVERTLTPENLLITDPFGPITLAGVMGAESTEVKDETDNIFLEAAIFDPAVTSRTSRGFALISEASLRYERGVDIEYTTRALDRAAALMAELAGGVVEAGSIDEYPTPYVRPTITLRTSRVAALIGEVVDTATCADYLKRLELEVAKGPADDELLVTVPAFRPDLRREVDLIEEVLRLYGMERVAATLPGAHFDVASRTTGAFGGLTREQNLRRRIDATLRAAGCNETMTFPFADPKDYAALDISKGADDVDSFVQLHNPLSQEQSILRSLLLPNLLHSVALNGRRGTKNVQLYELGTVFTTAQGRKQPKEREHLAVVLAGAWNKPSWNEPAVPLDFFDGKGIVELLLRELNIKRFRITSVEDDAYPYLQPGRLAELVIAGQTVGFLGELHPSVLAAFDTNEPVIAFELSTAALFKAATDVRELMSPPRFPGIDFDIALIVDDDMSAEALTQRIRVLGKKSPLAKVRLFDVYTGKGIDEGKKSLAFTLTYRACDRTLTSAEVEPAHERIVSKLKETTGATLR